MSWLLITWEWPMNNISWQEELKSWKMQVNWCAVGTSQHKYFSQLKMALMVNNTACPWLTKFTSNWTIVQQICYISNRLLHMLQMPQLCMLFIIKNSAKKCKALSELEFYTLFCPKSCHLWHLRDIKLHNKKFWWTISAVKKTLFQALAQAAGLI